MKRTDFLASLAAVFAAPFLPSSGKQATPAPVIDPIGNSVNGSKSTFPFRNYSASTQPFTGLSSNTSWVTFTTKWPPG